MRGHAAFLGAGLAACALLAAGCLGGGPPEESLPPQDPNVDLDVDTKETEPGNWTPTPDAPHNATGQG